MPVAAAALLSSAALGATITVSSPADGATLASPVHVAASASSSVAIDAMQIYVDNNLVYTVHAAAIDVDLSLPAGSHTLVVKSWEATGNADAVALSITVTSGTPPSGGLAVTALAPTNGATVTSPVRFNATATPATGDSIAAIQIYLDDQLFYTTQASTLDVTLPVAAGSHRVTYKAWENSGNSAVTTLTINVSTGTGGGGGGGTGALTVQVTSPTDGATVTSPVHFAATATASTGHTINAVQVYLDYQLAYTANGSTVDTQLAVGNGSHRADFKVWESTGNTVLSTVTFTVAPALTRAGARELVQSLSFQAGVTHVDGRYGFNRNNFLVEGGQQASNAGATSLFVYMSPAFRQTYIDRNDNLWPAADPRSLVALAQTTPYRTLFAMPFKTFVITAFTFANGDNVAPFASNTTAAATEEQEIHDLAQYLYSTYAGTGKVFILKNWEGDYVGLRGFDTAADMPPRMALALTNWLSARQRGVSRARAEAGDPSSVAVLHAAEVSLVLDVSQGRRRMINAVVPAVQPDLVSYSSWDSTLQGTDSASAAAPFNTALGILKTYAPDPLGLGDKRIFISEYGLYEKFIPDQTVWRTQTILSTARSAGLMGAFLWQLYDNQCKDANGSYFPPGSAISDPIRPVTAQCDGLWLLKPDGSESAVGSVLATYWAVPSSTPTAQQYNGVRILTATGENVTSPFRVAAEANTSAPTTEMRVYVDGVLQASVTGATLDASVVAAIESRTIEVQATDANGVVYRSSISTNVRATMTLGPDATLTVTPVTGAPPLGVSATVATGSGATGVTIDFGDGSPTVNAASANHMYSAVGSFTVRATVSGTTGLCTVTSVNVNVANPIAPRATINLTAQQDSPTSGSPLHVTATAQSSATSLAMVVYVDEVVRSMVSGASLDVSLPVAAGTHQVRVEAWGVASGGANQSRLVTANATATTQ